MSEIFCIERRRKFDNELNLQTMKKLILFLFVLVAGDVKGQTIYECNILPPNFWCNYYSFLDTLDFIEDSSLIIIDTANACNTWQLGHSYKPVFDSATSPLGLVTDTLYPYSSNSKCSFILKQPINGYPQTSILFFEHKYESDSLLDGGYIEYSCDYGQNWKLINGDLWQGGVGIYNYYNYLGLPGSLSNGTMSNLHDTVPAFTGTNVNWEWSGFQIIWEFGVMMPVETRSGGGFNCSFPPDTLYYRFTFESDSIDNSKAGWMIRNIVTGGSDYISSVPEFSSQPLKLFPNPATQNISIELPLNSGKLSSILISDIAGNVVASPLTPLQGERGTVDVSHLAPGIYFVLAETDKFVFRQKLVKQ